MLTPREKYISDPRYRAFVDMIESYLHRADFTPSEVREIAILACINYECKNLHHYRYPVELDQCLKKITDWTNKQKGD